MNMGLICMVTEKVRFSIFCPFLSFLFKFFLSYFLRANILEVL